MTLKELRKQKKLTQSACAAYLGIPLRTYQNYENDSTKAGSIKYSYLLNKLREYGYTDESHGVLTLTQIREVCLSVFREFEVEYCYLFGSYAKGNATEESDIDLLISTPISGIRFFELVEALREQLHKKIDVLNLGQLDKNPDLVHEILKDGVKLYG